MEYAKIAYTYYDYGTRGERLVVAEVCDITQVNEARQAYAKLNGTLNVYAKPATTKEWIQYGNGGQITW